MFLERIVYSCLICLHLFDSELQTQDLDHRDSNCNDCLNKLFKEPELNSDLFYIEKTIKENAISFDYRTLPFLRGVIEKKIEYAYNHTEAFDLSRSTHSTSRRVEDELQSKIYARFLNLLREIYQYEKDVKGTLEEQKQLIMNKIDEKVDEFSLDFQKYWEMSYINSDGVDKKIEKERYKIENMAIFSKIKQQEMKRSAEMFVINEKMNIMKNYSKMVANFSLQLEHFQPITQTNFFEAYENIEVIKGYQREISGRKIPDRFPKFQQILLDFNNALEEVSKEFDRQTSPYCGDALLHEKFNINEKEYYDMYVRQRQDLQKLKESNNISVDL